MKLQKETIERQESPAGEHGRWYRDACGAAFAMEIVGERWTLLIVRELMLGGRRFSDIRASLPGISAKVLTERLERLEDLAITTRRKLPPPAAAQVYELTEWGLALEPVMQELGRWSVRSPLHDPTLPLSPVSFMLSLRTMFDAERARGLSLTALFETSADRFLATLADGVLPVVRADEGARADLTLKADSVGQFAALFYGKLTPREAGVRVEGDAALLAKFTGLFALPEKIHGA